MTVKELKEQLNKLDESLTVYVEADHGQTPETCIGAYEVYNTGEEPDPYYLENSIPVELEEGQTYKDDWCYEGDVTNLDKHVIVYA